MEMSGISEVSEALLYVTLTDAITEDHLVHEKLPRVFSGGWGRVI